MTLIDEIRLVTQKLSKLSKDWHTASDLGKLTIEAQLRCGMAFRNCLVNQLYSEEQRKAAAIVISL